MEQPNLTLDSSDNCFQCFKVFKPDTIFKSEKVMCYFCMEYHCQDCMIKDQKEMESYTKYQSHNFRYFEPGVHQFQQRRRGVQKWWKKEGEFQKVYSEYQPNSVCRYSLEFMRLFKYIRVDK